MKNFVLRFASASVVVAFILGLYHFFGEMGLQFLIFLAPVLGGFELISILLPIDTSPRIKMFFYISLLTLFMSSVQSLLLSVAVLSILVVFFSAVVLLWSHDLMPLEKILNTITRSVFGFVYLGIFPAFAFKLLELPLGVTWFSALLIIVFSGDIGAYLIGIKWGKRKIVPRISPNKSLEGVVGGLLGSSLGAFAFYFILPDQNLVRLLPLAIIIGGIAQYGDYIESLMKRVADTKDSGSLMPGHGGVLDRIDGVLFAAPVMFVYVQFFN